jgi:erythronate-4-phosphate dehydrogenase
MKIIADPNIPFVREAFAALGEIELIPGRKMNAAAVRDAELLLVRSVTPVNAALLDGSKVRFVATATIGTDHVDAGYLASRQIGFASAAGSNANSVAEYIVAAMLELAHRRKFRLRDKTLGVIGVGNVGSRVVRYAEALGMRVLQNDPPRQRTEKSPVFVRLDRLLAESDILTLHVPLTREGEDRTFHLFDEGRLAALGRKPILINSSRGAVVDNAALLRAIQAGKLGGGVLDVWENEPSISLELLEAVDLATPHIAGYSFDGKVNGTTMIYRAACGFVGIKPTWEPTALMPAPAVPRIAINAMGQDDEDLLRLLVRRVYDINADDVALRARPREFDKLRAEYPVRREFFNTKVVASGADTGAGVKLAALGFQRD